MRCIRLAMPMASARPSSAAVPRPTSSMRMRLRGVAWRRMDAVSSISSMNVERSRVRSSAAPILVNTASTMPMAALWAGTKDPDWAMTASRAFWRKKVLFPPIFGPVMMASGEAARLHEFVTKVSPLAPRMQSMTGWRPCETSKRVSSVSCGRTYPLLVAASAKASATSISAIALAHRWMARACAQTYTHRQTDVSV